MSLPVKCIFILLFFDFHFSLSHDVLHSIKHILKDSSPPLVILLDAKKREGAVYDFAVQESSSEEKTNDEGAYVLYHLLRTAQETEPLDPEALRTFESTKDILRDALRSRCNRLQRCVKRCVKKVTTCTYTCQKEYDVYDVCKTVVTECYTCKKRGKTMPPYWLL